MSLQLSQKLERIVLARSKSSGFMLLTIPWAAGELRTKNVHRCVFAVQKIKLIDLFYRSEFALDRVLS